MFDLCGPNLTAEEKEKINHPNAGGLILFTRNLQSPDQVNQLVTDIRRIRRGKFLIAVDQEGGRVQRFRDNFSILPRASCYGDLYQQNPTNALQTCQLAGWLMATELRSVGVDFSFAPVLDVDSGISEIIGDRSFSTDPRIVSDLGIAFKHGARQAGMASVGKHFPGHGGVELDSHKTLPEDPRTLNQLKERDLKPFRDLIDDQIEAIMAAHVLFPEIDRYPAGFSEIWLKKILRGQLNFHGAIFSDDLTMEGAAWVGDFDDRAKIALEAGSDMILICNNPLAAETVLDTLPLNSISAEQQGRLAAMCASEAVDLNRQANLQELERARDVIQQLV